MTKYDNYDTFRRYDNRMYGAELAFNANLQDFIDDNTCVIKLRVTMLDSAFYPFGTEDENGYDIGGELTSIANDFLNALENEVLSDYSRIDYEFRDYLESEDVLAEYVESDDYVKAYVLGMMSVEGTCHIEDILNKFSKYNFFKYNFEVTA